MVPTLKAGDLVMVQPTPADQLQKNQVILVSIQGQLICHRLIRCFSHEGQCWAVTKGDRVAGEDPPVPVEKIAGVLTTFARPRFVHRLIWRGWRWGSRHLQMIRLGLTVWMFRMARGLEFFSLGLVRPEELVVFNQQYFLNSNQILSATTRGMDGLYPSESFLMDRLGSNTGTALVLGCAAGREAIALAERGWQVVGIDNVPSLINAAKENARRAGVSVEWLCLDLTRGFSLGRTFNVIFLFGQVYSLIPTRRLRVGLLFDCKRHLQPTGRCFVNFISGRTTSPRGYQAQKWRLRLARWSRGNTECELGDVLQGRKLFFHQFASWIEVAREAALAGLSAETQRDGVREDTVVLMPTQAFLDAGQPDKKVREVPQASDPLR